MTDRPACAAGRRRDANPQAIQCIISMNLTLQHSRALTFASAQKSRGNMEFTSKITHVSFVLSNKHTYTHIAVDGAEMTRQMDNLADSVESSNRNVGLGPDAAALAFSIHDAGGLRRQRRRRRRHRRAMDAADAVAAAASANRTMVE